MGRLRFCVGRELGGLGCFFAGMGYCCFSLVEAARVVDGEGG